VARFLGRHRFLLELMVMPVRDLMTRTTGETELKDSHVEAERSLLDALDRFKQSGGETLAVRDERGKTVGRLQRSDVMAALQRAATGNGN